MCLSNSRRVWTTSSAAAEGVEARTSATKSAMVKSVSWPTPEITGISRGGDSAGNDFLVEGPEIFERAAATGDDQDVNRLLAVEELHGTDDFCGGAISLHANGIKSELHIVEAAAENADDVADSGTGGGSDEPDAARKDAAGASCGLCGEEAFGFEALLELVEGEL